MDEAWNAAFGVWVFTFDSELIIDQQNCRITHKRACLASGSFPQGDIMYKTTAQHQNQGAVGTIHTLVGRGVGVCGLVQLCHVWLSGTTTRYEGHNCSFSPGIPLATPLASPTTPFLTPHSPLVFHC